MRYAFDSKMVAAVRASFHSREEVALYPSQLINLSSSSAAQPCRTKKGRLCCTSCYGRWQNKEGKIVLYFVLEYMETDVNKFIQSF
ncbi:hypothetical protein CDL15_Pgr017043 [Punica granatum]|uniref:Uncharacterized protein n=1 Tax=Punica granatum TaxID=22663 RepID=A0A218WYC6_PUNGR|nr:hypothetical protein CDL15_Pgr017043 [Punica granatum]PKI72978.1 hypothetical protein CRG98_006678 [Punica granatum]